MREYIFLCRGTRKYAHNRSRYGFSSLVHKGQSEACRPEEVKEWRKENIGCGRRGKKVSKGDIHLRN